MTATVSRIPIEEGQKRPCLATDDGAVCLTRRMPNLRLEESWAERIDCSLPPTMTHITTRVVPQAVPQEGGAIPISITGLVRNNQTMVVGKIVQGKVGAIAVVSGVPGFRSISKPLFDLSSDKVNRFWVVISEQAEVVASCLVAITLTHTSPQVPQPPKRKRSEGIRATVMTYAAALADKAAEELREGGPSTDATGESESN